MVVAWYKAGSRFKKILLLVGAGILALIVVLAIINWLTPVPLTSFAKRLFTSPSEAAIEATSSDVQQKLDVSYGSQPQEAMDILWPKQAVEPLPVIFWVHGGGFVGGDKSSVLEYATRLASHGYVVVSINYSLAPEARYPTPLRQLGSAYEHAIKQADKYHIDKSRVIFGGDSAGAQIALQFANIQTNPEYSKQVDIDPVAPAEAIRAAVSLSGLLDLERYAKTTSKSANYLYDRAGWAYFNDRHWQSSSIAKQASVVGNISSNFPATFVTDGNTDSFEDQARDFVDELKKYDIPVSSRFYDSKDVILGHQFQFASGLAEAEEVFDLLVEFLQQHTK